MMQLKKNCTEISRLAGSVYSQLVHIQCIHELDMLTLAAFLAKNAVRSWQSKYLFGLMRVLYIET